ncbi:MAG: ABC transporter permease [Prevotellaceae bacterium]|jgi:hypothetical protein|nr:ABC transporter permease [Prevotellaceae bacterium]
MLNKLLRQNISIPQFAGYFITALIAMSIIFTAFGFSMDVKPIFSPVGNGLFTSEYMVVTKKISALSLINSKGSIFSDKEVEEIASQEFVKSISYFTPCKYSVYAYMESTTNYPALSTEMFFESVPDRLLDGAGKDWKWSENENFIPVILPRDYLALYNFGFAGSRGLPQISEEIVKSFTFNILISNGNKKERFKSRIAGFSSYLNTILVPEAFMEWANRKFGDSEPIKKSKLLIEVKNSATPEIAEFFSSKNYDVKENKGEQGKLSYFLKIIITAVSVIGLLILLPAMGLMFLSINLLIYKNRKTLGNLILLGYSRTELALPYCILVLCLNLLTGLGAFTVFAVTRNFYIDRLNVLNIGKSPINITTILFVIISIMFVTLLSMTWIRKKIGKITPPVRG